MVVSAGEGQKGGQIGQRGHCNCCDPVAANGKTGMEVGMSSDDEERDVGCDTPF